MTTKRFSLVLGVLGLAFSSMAMAEGRDVGNGGGVWTCRDGLEVSGRIRTIQVVDLYEGRQELGLNIPLVSDLSFEALLDSVERKIFSVNPQYFVEYSRHIQRVRRILQTRDGIQLEVINDALYSSRPAPESCENGTIRYEQLANYRSDGIILVDERLWRELPAIDRAALYVHEAVYALLREKENTPDSRKARRLTGYLFSSELPSNYAHLLTLPAPPAPPMPPARPEPELPPALTTMTDGFYLAQNPLLCAIRLRSLPRSRSIILEWVNFGGRNNCQVAGRSYELGCNRYRCSTYRSGGYDSGSSEFNRLNCGGRACDVRYDIEVLDGGSVRYTMRVYHPIERHSYSNIGIPNGVIYERW